jgi:hypothetical protein
MTTMVRAPEASREEAVVTKAFLRAGSELGLSGKQLSRIIDVSEAHISRMGNGLAHLALSRNHQWGASLLLIRIYRALIATVGSQAQAKLWLHGYNSSLHGVPVQLIESYEWLIDVARYLDFQRGQF